MQSFQLFNPLSLKFILSTPRSFCVSLQSSNSSLGFPNQRLDFLFDQSARQTAQTQFGLEKLPSVTGDFHHFHRTGLAQEGQTLADRAFAHAQFRDNVSKASRSRRGIEQPVDSADGFRGTQHVKKPGKQCDTFLFE